MLQLYAMKITEQDVAYLEKVSACFGQERREQLNRCKNIQTAMCSACGELMARVLIGQQIGKEPFEIEYRKNRYGKPYIEGTKYQFNISHSGEWVFCGISSKKIGVDVEKIKEINEKIAKRCFTKNEYTNLIKKTVEQQRQYFYTLWTLKESYVKYIGQGLRIPLDSVEFIKCDEQMKIRENPEQLVVSNGIWKDEYTYSVIGKEILKKEDIVELNITDFIKNYC